MKKTFGVSGAGFIGGYVGKKLVRSFFSISFLISIILAGFSTTAYATTSTLGVTQISAVKTFAQANNNFTDGWKWVFDVTVPTNETILNMKFADWVNVSGGTIPANGNIRFYSSQSSNASDSTHAISIDTAGTYSGAMNLALGADLSGSQAERQIQVTVETKVPEGSSGGSYTTNYGLQSNLDTIVPVITLVGEHSITLEAGSTYADAGATATDNVDGSVAVTNDAPATVPSVGPYTITYSATDSAGNHAAAVTRTIVVVDTTDPTITAPANVSVSTDAGKAFATVSSVTLGTPTTADNVHVASVTSDAQTTFPIGATTVTWTVTDSAGLTNTATQTVTVTDTEKPVITLNGPADLTVAQGSTYTDAGATASDNVDGNITTGIVPVSTANTAIVGTYTVSYNVSDSAHNAAIEVIRTVHVTDQTAPTAPTITTSAQSVKTDTIVIAGTAEVGSTVKITGGASEATGTATDGSYSITVTLTKNAVNTLSVTATDVSGNVSAASTVAITHDNTAPTATVSISEAVISPNASAGVKDTSSVDVLFSEPVHNAYINIKDVSNNLINTLHHWTNSQYVTNPDAKEWNGKNTAGSFVVDGVYTVEIIATDAAGNTLTNTSNIITVDNTLPIITRNGVAEVTMTVGGTYTDAGATVTEGLTVTPTGSVDVGTVGVYTITYSATDLAGNSADVVTRTVHVVAANADQSAPTDLNGVAPTSALNDGQITGVSALMEYKLSSVSQYAAINDTTVVGLVAGNYDVRFAANTGLNASIATTVTVPSYVAPSSEKAITAFSFAGLNPVVAGTVNETNHTIVLTVPYGTDVSSLVATFTVSAGASVKVGEYVQTSGTTPNDFTGTVTYKVTAADSSFQNYAVTVNVTAASTAAEMTSFVYTPSSGSAINGVLVDSTFTLTVPNGTNLETGSITTGLSAGATVKPESGTAYLSSCWPMACTYTVTAQDGSTTKDYTVVVVVESAPVAINIPALGVTAPVVGETPATTITVTDQYTGTVAWSGTLNGDKFAASTDYTATITLTAKTGYTLTGVAENFFTVAGATTATNPADSGVVTVVFPTTATN